MKRRLKMSASQMETANLCLARWGFERILERFEPESDNPNDPAVLGSFIHKQVETWQRGGPEPTHGAARALMKYAPAPGIASCEVPISYELGSGPYKGFIDLAYSEDVAGNPLPLGETYDVVLMDWKTCGDIYKAKKVDELLQNLAVNIYTMEAWLAGAMSVTCRWVYVERTHPFRTKEVVFVSSKAKVSQRMAEIDARARELQSIYALGMDPNQLEKNRSACFAYGRPCYQRSVCTKPKSANVGFMVMNTSEEDMSVVSQARSVMMPPAVPNVPEIQIPEPSSVPQLDEEIPDVPDVEEPAAPAAPEPPVSQSKAAQDIDRKFKLLFTDEPESGYVNPPEAPVAAVATPEELAAIQGIEPVDPLDKMSMKELKEKLKELGMTNPKPLTIANVRAAIKEAVARRDALLEEASNPEPSRPIVETVSTDRFEQLEKFLRNTSALGNLNVTVVVNVNLEK